MNEARSSSTAVRRILEHVVMHPGVSVGKLMWGRSKVTVSREGWHRQRDSAGGLTGTQDRILKVTNDYYSRRYG